MGGVRLVIIASISFALRYRNKNQELRQCQDKALGNTLQVEEEQMKSLSLLLQKSNTTVREIINRTTVQMRIIQSQTL